MSFSGVNGGWIHCGSTLSAWNTHVELRGVRAGRQDPGGSARRPTPTTAPTSTASASITSAIPPPPIRYHYGLVPEVTVDRDGTATVVKHYATGRFAREMLEMASDNRTGIGGDDGKNTGLFMFVADKAKDLSAGHALRRQGHADRRRQRRQLRRCSGSSSATRPTRRSRPWSTAASSSATSSTSCRHDPAIRRYTKVTTYMGTEWLKLKPGMEKAAAFLETRRYAALLGATTEFSKMEYIAFNARDRQVLRDDLPRRGRHGRHQGRHPGRPQRRRHHPRDEHGHGGRRTRTATRSTATSSAPRWSPFPELVGRLDWTGRARTPRATSARRTRSAVPTTCAMSTPSARCSSARTPAGATTTTSGRSTSTPASSRASCRCR